MQSSTVNRQPVINSTQWRHQTTVYMAVTAVNAKWWTYKRRSECMRTQLRQHAAAVTYNCPAMSGCHVQVPCNELPSRTTALQRAAVTYNCPAMSGCHVQLLCKERLSRTTALQRAAVTYNWRQCAFSGWYYNTVGTICTCRYLCLPRVMTINLYIQISR